MKFTEFTISTTSEVEDLVADILWKYTTFGVAICDGNDLIALTENKREMADNHIEELQIAEDNSAFVKAYIEISETDRISSLLTADFDSLKENAKGNIEVGTMEITKRIVDGDDWIAIWKKHFRPIKYGEIVICPKWIKYDQKPDEKVIYIDSNVAFGTGEHETTAMCIKLLSEYVKGDMTVLDIGTGSGILGIAAIKAGAKRAIMTDIENVAVLAARHNAEMNEVAEHCEVLRADLLDGISDIGDLAVANITAEILIRLTDDIKRQLKRDGILILSGIINSRLNCVKDEFVRHGFKFVKSVNDGEWNSLVLQNVGL